MIKDTEVWVEIPYEVCDSVYRAEIYLPDIIEAKKKGGDKAVEKLVEEMVEEDFHQNVYFSYDLYEFTEELDKEYGTKINEMNEEECLPF